MARSVVVSLGYEGRTVEELVAQLRREGVTVLVDVRLTPLSRKPGLSKRRLAATLEAVGIRYLHLKALGNPKENRVPFRAGDPASHRAFRSLLSAEGGAGAVREVASELASGETVALLCFERDHVRCHRHLVTEELVRTEPSLELVAL